MISVASSLAAMNIVVAAVCAIVAGVMIHRYRAREISTDALLMSFGCAVFAGGWSVQRLYWAVNRSLESVGNEYLLTSIYRTTSWVTLIPLSFVLFGAGYLLEPLLSGVYGNLWFAKYMATVFFCWLTIALLL